MIKNIFAGFVCVLVGAVFVFSAIAKLFPIELFEYTFVELGVSSWSFSPVLARFAIGAELLLGSLLVFCLLGKKKYTLLASVLVLLFFSIYLIWSITKHGNTGNCGCFGSYLKMTPLESLIKNIFLLAAVAFIYLSKFKGLSVKFNKLIFVVFLSTSLAMPFILNPLGYDQFKESDLKGDKIAVDLYYEENFNPKPPVDVRKGKHLIAFMSLTCPHCKLAGYKMSIMKKNNKNLSIYFFLNGDSAKLKSFMDETKAYQIPYSFMSMKQGFVQNAGNSLPAIYLVNNGIIEKRKNYVTLDQNEIENWLNK